MTPVDQAEIGPGLDASLSDLFIKRFQEIPFGRGIFHCTKMFFFGIPQGHTIMVLGGYDRIPCTRCLDEISQAAGS